MSPSPAGMVVLLLVGGTGVVLLEQVIRRTGVGFALLAGVVVLDTLLFAVPLGVQVGPFAVYPREVVFGLLGVAAVARLLRSPRVDPLHVLVLLFLLLTVWSAVRGVPLHGPGATLNEARKHLTYGSSLLYFSTIPVVGQHPDRFLRWWLRLGVYLLAVAVLRWTAFFTGVHDLLPQGDTLRVLDSFDTVVLLTGMLLAAGPMLRDRGPGHRLDAPARAPLGFELFVVGSFLAVVLLQHRTLWLALILGVVLLTARDPRLTGRLLVATVLGGVLVSVTAIAVFGQGVERVVTEDLGSSATEVGTFEWRVEGWSRLVETSMPDSSVELVLGQPFGAGFDRYLDGRLVTVSPHNYYLESFLRVGVLGLAAFVLLHAIVLVRLYPATRRSGWLRYDAVAVAVVVLLVYYATSHPHPEHGALTGFAVALAVHAGPRRRRVASSAPGPAQHPSVVPV